MGRILCRLVKFLGNNMILYPQEPQGNNRNINYNFGDFFLSVMQYAKYFTWIILCDLLSITLRQKMSSTQFYR